MKVKENVVFKAIPDMRSLSMASRSRLEKRLFSSLLVKFFIVMNDVFFAVSSIPVGEKDIFAASVAEPATLIGATSGFREPHNQSVETAVTEALRTEAIWFGFSEEVSIATRHETPIGKAPGIVTVITADEIKNLGYRTFAEILRTIPGFEILKDALFGAVAPAVRGLVGSEKIRVMLNGHLVNTPLSGGAFTRFDDFPVENIKRIELIRGPGSAVYGENAFLAVINIITKDTKDIDGIRISSGYGSFDTYDENVVFGKTFGKVDISGMAHYRQTSGFDGTVDSDYQTSLDNSLPTPPFPDVSLAPGRVRDKRQQFDLNLRVVYQDFYFEGMYLNKDKEPFIGPQSALNDESDIENNYVFGEVGYQKTFEDTCTIKPRLYYDQFDDDFFIESLPDGTTIRNNSGIPVTFPDGFIGDGKVSERVVGTEIPCDYQLFDDNLLTLGFEYRLINQTNVDFSSNFHPGTLDPLPEIQDFSDQYPFLKEVTRRIWSLYVQDAWDIADTVNLTLGIRHDQYSDFGNAISPRSALTWAFMENASLKVLYGEAFRAPSLEEMYITNQPAIVGNEDLDPETIRTYEVGLSYQVNKYVASSVNYFYSDVEDLITMRPRGSIFQFENLGDAHIQGIEMETRVSITKENYLFMNYTYQNPEDNRGNDLPFVARHYGNFGVNARPCKYINANLSAFFSGNRSRDDDDPDEERDDLSSYALLNLSLIAKEFFKSMEVQGTVFNLLDKDYSDPGPPEVSDDLPRPGRTFFVGLSYQF